MPIQKHKGKGIFDYYKTVRYGRNNYPPYVRDLIAKYGNKIIKEIVIVRTPLSKLTYGALNIVSLGQIQRNLKNQPYDKLYHLRINITLEDNTHLALEKNEVINMVLNPSLENNSETKQVKQLPINLTLNDLLKGGEKIQGDKYFKYNGYDNNCQDYIMALFKGSGIGDEQDFNFIKQDTKSLFENNQTLINNIRRVTDLGAKINEIRFGTGLSKIQSVLFKKPEWSHRRAVNWLKKHDFKGLELDEKPEHLRYRQLDPQEMENNNYHFITKPLHKNIEFIIGYQNNTMPRKQKLEDFNSDSDSDTDSDTSSECSEDERDIKRKMKDIRRHIRRHQIKGGKLNIANAFKKLGSTIKQGLQPVANYVTAKKGGLASDLLHEGVPIVTGALCGAVGEYFGGPMGGIVAGELGSRAGEAGANALGKKIGVGLKRRGRPPKASGSGDLIHIDISSHNAKGKKASNKMEGGFLVNEHPVPHRGFDTTTSVPSFSQTLATKKLVSANSLLNELTSEDLKDVKHILSSEEPATKLSPAQRKKIADKMKTEFKKNMAKIKEEEAEKHKPKRSHHKKGSEEAKEHMARLRAMRKNK